jgi:hypothetical protein
VLSDLEFLFSAKTENPDRFFQGYFFHNADYVFGEGGFEAFCRARELDRLLREDGCYVQAEKQQGGYYRFSTDYNGYKKLFYFWDSGFWVVSNSLYQIAAHIREHGYRVLPDSSQLAAMATEGTFYPSGRGSFFSQLTSFDTIVRGVRLVPADCALWIGSSGVRMERTIHPHSPDDNYRYQLERFISTWIGRFNTLVNDPCVQISCDLTGGLDSRAVFALLLSAVRGCDSSIASQLQIRSGPGFGAWKDRAVAARICKHFGLSLNGRPATRPIWLNGKASYALWKDLCLGVYHPIYFPSESPSGRIVHLGGGGGENQRPFYSQFPGAPSADSFVARRTRNLVCSARPGFEVALRQAIDKIMDGAPEYLDALALHYRHFRNRFHAGREPQYAVTFHPLASKLLDNVTDVAGKSRFQNAQMHYDILHNLKPELLDMPFDSWRKRPGRGVRRSLASITARPCPSGTCFIGDARHAPEETRKGKERAGPIGRLREEFHWAKTGFAADFLGNAYVRLAERGLKTAARKGRFSGPIQSKRVAVVMACAMFNS